MNKIVRAAAVAGALATPGAQAMTDEGIKVFQEMLLWSASSCMQVKGDKKVCLMDGLIAADQISRVAAEAEVSFRSKNDGMLPTKSIADAISDWRAQSTRIKAEALPLAVRGSVVSSGPDAPTGDHSVVQRALVGGTVGLIGAIVLSAIGWAIRLWRRTFGGY